MLAFTALRMLNIDEIPFWPYAIFAGASCGVLAAYIAAISGYRMIIEDDHAAIRRGEAARREKA